MSETRHIAQHALTVLIGQLAVMAFGIADTVIAGHHSPQALATLSIASSIFVSVYVALNGLIQALLPVWARLLGAGQLRDIGRSVRQALYIGLGASLLGTAVLACPDPWLRATEVPTAFWPEVRQYMQVLALAVWPSLMFRMYGTLNQSLGMPRLVTALQTLALLIKIPLSYGLTLGLGPWPGMGIIGCAWATLITQSLMMGTAVWLVARSPVYRPYQLWQRMERMDAAQIREFLRLGIPAGLSILVEVTSFTLMSLFIARQGAVASASHQIASSLAALLYMVPLALGIATSARTGFWIGAHRMDRARHAIRVGLLMALGLALLCSASLWLGREWVARAFTADQAVALAAAVWLGVVAFYHLADALQAVCIFVLRCFGITLMPLLIYAGFLWGLGLMGGYLLAYHGLAGMPARPQVDSFWMTSSGALLCVSLIFLGLVWHAARPRVHRT